MAMIRPFRPFRPRVDLAARVASPPYDVVDRDQARALCRDNPVSFLHVVRPDADLPEDVPPHDDRVYHQAAQAWSDLRRQGIMCREETPRLYLYELIWGAHRQRGIVGTVPVADYDTGRIKKHERTRPDKEEDRLRHMLALRAQPGPVFLAGRSNAAWREALDRVQQVPPDLDFEADDGVRHRVWPIADAEPIQDALASVEALYIADGHHRSAAASRAAAQLDRRGEASAFLAVVFPADELQILPYNRHVHDLAGLTEETFLDALRRRWEVREEGAPQPAAKGHVSMFLGQRWWSLHLRAGDRPAADPVAGLDAALLQEHLLGPILGIDDPRRSSRIDFVGGIHGPEALEQRVADRPGSVAFSLYPLSMGELMAVADAGEVLPPKSTWFEPKLRSGLFVHAF